MSNPLRILKPIPITDSMLTNCSIPEDDYPAWNAATAYAVGDRVIRATTHRVYERIVAGTTATEPEADTVNWANYDSTNRWKMFDSVVGSQSVASGNTITISLTPNAVFNGVALLGITATSVRVKVINSIDGTVYDTTKQLQSPPAIPDYWTYFFSPIVQKKSMAAIDLPTYVASTVVEITITNTDGNASCGTLLIGHQQAIGDQGIQLGAQVGITDYSRKERNAFGEYMVTERAWNKVAKIEMLVPNNQIDGMQALFSSIRATPTLFVGSDDYESLVVYGYYKEFSAVISYPTHSQMNLEIEGLI